MLYFAHKAGTVALFTFFTPIHPAHSTGFPAVAVLAKTLIVLLVIIDERPFARSGDLLGATVPQSLFMIGLLWCAARIDGETSPSEEAAFVFVVFGVCVQAATDGSASYRRRRWVVSCMRRKSVATT